MLEIFTFALIKSLAKKNFMSFKESMRCEFNTYNYTIPKYYTDTSAPNFKARPIKVNWKSESGQLIEKTLMAFAAAATAAGISGDENLKSNKKYFENNYKRTKDPNIVDKHAQLYKDAYKSRDLLRGGYSDIYDEDIDHAIVSLNTVVALNILGKGNLESAFELDIIGFNNFKDDLAILQGYLRPKDIELLKKKINPENTKEYRKLEEEVKEDKKAINSLLGEENIAKRDELREEIEALKKDKNNEQQIRELKKEIQNLYRNCENSSEITGLMQNIGQKQRKMKEILAQKVNLSPQEIINKVWTIATLCHCDKYQQTLFIYNYPSFLQLHEKMQSKMLEEVSAEELKKTFDNGQGIMVPIAEEKRLQKDVLKLINLINPSTKENDAAWEEAIDEIIFDRLGFLYDKKFSALFKFSKCKYLNQLIISDKDFWDNMDALVNSLIFNAASSRVTNESWIEMALDNMDHNWETRKLFEKNKLDYDKWKHYDKNSYIEGKIAIKKEDVQNKAVKNMCYELTNDRYMKNIPHEIKESLYNALKEIGLTINGEKVLINGRAINYTDLPQIMSVIRKEIHTNSFWQEEQPEEIVDDARSNIYNHFMYQRKQDIDNIKKLKDNEEVNIRVQKVDMCDLKHSLSLGNDAHCCTALGSQSNEWSAPAYILTRGIGAIEVLAEGESIGNTMMYVAKVNGKFGLILDDIELQTKYQNNDQIRDMIIKYAKQICEDIGKADMPIYAGPGLHKVNMSEFEFIEQANVKILGRTPVGIGIYLDYDGIEHLLDGKSEKFDLYRIA